MPPQEFPSDEHRENHVAALVREKAGYEARAKAHESKGEDDLASQMRGRAAQANDELDRLAKEAKTPAQRAARRGRGKAEVAESQAEPEQEPEGEQG